jgi:AraC-like DNA-binding protein
MQQIRLVRSASLNGYVELVQSLGYDPLALLRSANLSLRLLENPEALIPSGAVRRVLEASAQATGSEDFALQLAMRRTLSDLGPISLVLQEEPTAREALDTLQRYSLLLNTSLVTRIEDVGQTVVIREDLLPIPGAVTRQALDLTVGVMFRTLRELIGPGWRPLEVCFTHRAPRSTTTYRSLFGRVPKFNHSFNGMVCAAADLQRQRALDHVGAARFAREHLDAVLQHRTTGVGDSCRQLMLGLLPSGRCTAQQLAYYLRIDRRTLHRYLSDEGLTFSSLLHQMRTELARRHLRESDRPIGEVAGLLGFSTHSGFSHWFHAAFGCSVSQMRAQWSAVEPPSGE